MEYVLNTFAQLSGFINSDNTTTDPATIIDDVDMFMVNLPWVINNEEPQNSEEVQSDKLGFDVVNDDKEPDYNMKFRGDYEERENVPEGTYRSYEPCYSKATTKDEAKGDDEQTNARDGQCTGFDVKSDDDDSDWNIRSDYEERYHVYKMPSDTYRSYEPEDWNNDESIEDDRRCVRNVKSDDSESDWNIRSDYEERYYVYKMPSDTYRSYEPEDWKNDESIQGDGRCVWNASRGQEEMQSIETVVTEKESEDGIPKARNNNIQEDNGKIERRNLCHTCRIFYDAGEGKDGAQKNRFSLRKKLLSWRKKRNDVPCGKCGYGIRSNLIRSSTLKKIFGVGLKSLRLRK